MSDIIFVGVNDWRAIKQRPQHLAERLASSGRHRVVYVNPVGYSVLTHLYRVAHRATHRGWGATVEELCERLWVFTPSPALPLSRRNRYSNLGNQALLAAQLQPVLQRLGFHEPLLWVSFPTGCDLLGRLGEAGVVFDCLDDFPEFFRGRERASVAAMESKLLAHAGLVLATSQPLYEKCRNRNPNSYLVPNGVDFSHFANAQASVAPDLISMPHPRFLYVGTIGRWTDIETLAALASGSPRGSVVVVGPWEVPQPHLPPNLQALGPRPYEQLPAYMAACDVALIPFKIGALTQSVNPVKLFEYGAAGLPVVATATAELARYSKWCDLAATREEFVALALQAAGGTLRGANQNRVATARAEASANDWQARVDQIENLIAPLGRRG